jgi:transposase
MLGCAILPANVQDRDGCLGVLKAVQRLFPFLERVVADGAYQGRKTARAVRRAARARLEIVKRSDGAKGFAVLPKRWIVERTFGWLGRCRRLAKDFEGPHAHPSRLHSTGHDPPHDASDRKSLSNLIISPDGL